MADVQQDATSGPGAPMQAQPVAPDDKENTTPAVEFIHVSIAFDDDPVLEDVSFVVPHGRMTILIGPSGSGKSVILKLALGLLRPDCGVIRVNGTRVDTLSESKLIAVRDHIGMLFQEGALFDSLTVEQNVGYKLYDAGDMPEADVRVRVRDVLGFIGLEPYMDRMPSELSGGQRRRVAIARAVAAGPQLVLFDEPTSGLDPITAKTVDAEILKLRDLSGVTAIVVTHQLQDAFYLALHDAVREAGTIRVVPARHARVREAHFLLLRDGRIHFDGDVDALRRSDDPYIHTYLAGWVPPLVPSDQLAGPRAELHSGP